MNMTSTQKWIIVVAVAVIIAVVGFALPHLGGSGFKGEHYVLQITNPSKYTIAPGVYAIHNYPGYTMNFYNTIAPKEYEKLAEIGDPSEVLAALATNESILVSGKTSDAPIPPGGSVDIPLDLSVLDENPEAMLSFMAMVVESNDGVVWLHRHQLLQEREGGTSGVRELWDWSWTMDLGTEENSPLGSGFAGGQPDPARGAANLDNGVATEEVATVHEQFPGEQVVRWEIKKVVKE